MRIFVRATRVLVVLTVLTGVVYPVAVYFIGKSLFPNESMGSLILLNDKIVGSKLIAQKFQDPKYFHPRPSSGDFATVPSQASNFGPLSKDLKSALEKRASELGEEKTEDMLATSGSGLDPHISLESSLKQVNRIVQARKLSQVQTELLRKLVLSNIELPHFGFIGTPKLNVLVLNIALEEQFR